MASNTIVI